MSTPFNAILIGAGSAGLSALHEIRKHTEHFLVIHDGAYGTTCARKGCMPSKLLIEAANAFHHRHALEEFGIQGSSDLTADIPAVLRRVRKLRDEFVAGATAATRNLGARSVAGKARLLGPDTVQVNNQTYRAKRIVLATGSHPLVPQSWEALGTNLLTTDTLFEQDTLGSRIAVVGMGPLGLEMAQALARLGVQVSGYATHPMLGGLTDPSVNHVLHTLLSTEFALRIGEEAQIQAIPGGIEVRSGASTIVVDQVLAAMGRHPNIQGLGLESLGVPLDKHGMPPINPHSMQVGDLPVFMAGDAAGYRPLLHEAIDEGHIAGMNAMSLKPDCFTRRTPLSIVFSSPQVAIVGQSYQALQSRAPITGTVNFANQGRARAAQNNHGCMHVYVDPANGELLGAELCAPAGEHLAHILALAIYQKMSVHDLLGMPFYHPVLEEGLRTALRNAARQLPAWPSVSDLGNCDPIGADALD